MDIFAVFWPFLSLAEIPVIDPESIAEYPVTWLCLAFYGVTSLWAGFVARRLAFRKYQLSIIRGVPSAVLGCFLFWPFCFSWFLVNREAVRSGAALLKTDAAKKRTFPAWPAVAVWLLISSVIAACAVPSLLSGRMRANEATAAVILKQYAEAQREYANNGTGPYADDFRELLLNPVNGIGQIHQDPQAFMSALLHPSARDDRSESPEPYRGYFFFADPFVSENNLWKDALGFMAYPAEPWKTGVRAYWIGKEGKVLFRVLPRDEEIFRRQRPDESPLHPESAFEWKQL